MQYRKQDGQLFFTRAHLILETEVSTGQMDDVDKLLADRAALLAVSTL